MRRRPRRTRTLNELNERLKVGIRTFGPNRSYTSKRTAPCFFRERQGAVLCCLVEMRTMKRPSFNRAHLSNRKVHPRLRLSCLNGAIILEPISIALAWSGFSACAFRGHCHMRTFATHAQSDYRSACPISSFAFISTAPPASPSTANPNGPTRPKPCPDFAKNGRNLRL